jgi:hypothetical protein
MESKSWNLLLKEHLKVENLINLDERFVVQYVLPRVVLKVEKMSKDEKRGLLNKFHEQVFLQDQFHIQESVENSLVNQLKRNPDADIDIFICNKIILQILKVYLRVNIVISD